MYELWGQGSDYEELEESIRNFPEERKSPYLQPGSSFKISVESFGKAISFQEQNERIQGLAYIPFKKLGGMLINWGSYATSYFIYVTMALRHGLMQLSWLHIINGIN
ncbi:hypothetical protein Csa_018203 [Cucumis sativus]|nr:hypothetical protein Csa_018203 [Cucumis sativus]